MEFLKPSNRRNASATVHLGARLSQSRNHRLRPWPRYVTCIAALRSVAAAGGDSQAAATRGLSCHTPW